MKRVLAVIALGLSSVLALAPLASASTGPVSHALFSAKQRYSHTGEAPHAQYYNIYTENDYRHWTQLQLTRQGNVYLPRFTVNALHIAGWNFPNIGQGANHGMFPAKDGKRKTWYPVRANHDGDPYVTYRDRLIWQGNWQAGFDAWFEPRYDVSGQWQQHGGTELMILNAVSRHGRAVSHGLPGRDMGSAFIDGRWWNVEASSTGSSPKRWHRIYLVAQKPFSAFSGPLNGFFRAAEHFRMLDGNAWLTGIEYGFEINQGGVGMAVSSYDMHGIANATARHAGYDLGVTVPRVTGLHQAAAVRLLQRKGLKARQLTAYRGGRTLVVTAQGTRPGTRVPHGRVVTIRSITRLRRTA